MRLLQTLLEQRAVRRAWSIVFNCLRAKLPKRSPEAAPEPNQCSLPCEKGCKVCSGAAECLECALTVLDPVTKTCQPCSVANCFEW